jgi:hypothetical protein
MSVIIYVPVEFIILDIRFRSYNNENIKNTIFWDTTPFSPVDH